ncbi:hypothetical protein BDZ90DRAFT_103339 [Jaminaea rosea]|uniref:MoaB/Mog domain-containing protein n=1 Tax=Jaminaea rosea TaxID=1569628 RepID=A0A316UND6_9BASI|nr:hypothetical protein BDZ90DRAFT_103339 [Jaminaea rosea]PWN24665.1 hypothetical protein BDZ90DRAFT_103339 [Jaminaea rosea]
MPPLYSFAVLTVSDTSASSGPSTDTSGPHIRRTLESHPSDSFRCSVHAIVPDDEGEIRGKVEEWIDEMGVDLVVTTGGTGFGVRDTTPEAIQPLITRPTPALTHALTAHSLSKTPLAALSRSISGIRTRGGKGGSGSGSGSLIVTLPGSKKAVSECLEVLLENGVLLHALELCTGKGSGKETHRQLQGGQHDRHAHAHAHAHGTETDTGGARSHHHHHHHGGGGHHPPRPRTTQAQRDAAASRFLTPHDASSPHSLALRARQSPYPIIELDDALRLIATQAPEASAVVELPVNPELVGHIIAEDVRAPSDLPPAATSNVDGYAVRAGETGEEEYEVVIPGRTKQLAHGSQVCRVNTGQALPAGTDSVVMVEDTTLISTHELEDGRVEESRVQVLAQVDKGENVRAAGSDVKQDQVVLRANTPITSLGGEVGTLAFLGLQKVKVWKKPRVAVLSTGEELRDIHAQSSKMEGSSSANASGWSHSSYDTNRPSLLTSLNALGYPTLDLGIVRDDPPSALLEAMRRGLAEADVLITTGGTSMGESDWIKPLLERSEGLLAQGEGEQGRAQVHFGRVSMKPGKPTTFATIAGGEGRRKKVIFALPGNPASALVCFYVFVLPALRKMAGLVPREHEAQGVQEEGKGQQVPNPWSLPMVRVRLAHEFACDGSRPEFHRVHIAAASEQRGGSALLPSAAESGSSLSLPVLTATSTGKQRSSGMHSMSGANGFVFVPSTKQLAGAGMGEGVKKLEKGTEMWGMLLGGLEI